MLEAPLPPLIFTSNRKSTTGKATVRPHLLLDWGDDLKEKAKALQKQADHSELLYPRMPASVDIDVESEAGIGGVVQHLIVPSLNIRANRVSKSPFRWVQLPSSVDFQPNVNAEERQVTQGWGLKLAPPKGQVTKGGGLKLAPPEGQGGGVQSTRKGKEKMVEGPDTSLSAAGPSAMRPKRACRERGGGAEGGQPLTLGSGDLKDKLNKKKRDFLLRKRESVIPQSSQAEKLAKLLSSALSSAGPPEKSRSVAHGEQGDMAAGSSTGQSGAETKREGRGELREPDPLPQDAGAAAEGSCADQPLGEEGMYRRSDGRLVIELKYKCVPENLIGAFNDGDPTVRNLVGQAYGYMIQYDLDMAIVSDYDKWHVSQPLDETPVAVRSAGPFHRGDREPTVMAVLCVAQDEVLNNRMQR